MAERRDERRHFSKGSQSSVSLSQQLLGQAGKKPSNHKAELYTANSQLM